jgi:hypothetical protein
VEFELQSWMIDGGRLFIGLNQGRCFKIRLIPRFV